MYRAKSDHPRHQSEMSYGFVSLDTFSCPEWLRHPQDTAWCDVYDSARLERLMT